jgi:DNA (cytosine-5)-methyltransferase 1
MKKKILNLFAGLGGNSKNWDRNMYEITAVEIDPKIARVYQENNPNDIVVVGDAMEFLKNNREGYDIAWVSPPCQKHSRMMKATRHDVADFFDATLYQCIIFLDNFFKGKWVVENVKPYYKPLIEPTCVMGRHLFWANFPIMAIESPNIKGFITSGTVAESQKLKDWLGIQYEGNLYYKGNHCPSQVLRNCVHPRVGEHILNELENN